MVYEIWDLESGNAVGDFETRESALAEVRAMVEAYGREEMLPWALARIDGETMTAVAEGEHLINLALAVMRQAAGASGPTTPPVATSSPPPTAHIAGTQAGQQDDDPLARGMPMPPDPDPDDLEDPDDDIALGLAAPDWNALVEHYSDPAVSSEAELRHILAEVTPERRAWFGTIARVKLHEQDVAGNPFNQGEVVRVTSEDDPITRAGKLLQLNELKRRLIRGW